MLSRLALLSAFLGWQVPGQSSSSPLEQALLAFNSGNYRECFQIVAPYVRAHPESGAGHKLLGMDEYMLGKPREALLELQQAVALSPQDPDAAYYLGRLYFSTDNAPAALAAFQRAIELNPLSVRAHNHLGQTYEALGRPDDGERAYLKAISLEEGQASRWEWPYYNLALLYFQSGRWEESKAYFRRSLACNPQFPEAKVKLAVLLSKQKLASEALTLLTEALQTEPRNAEAHYRMALLLTQSGKPDEAQEHFQLFEKYRKP